MHSARSKSVLLLLAFLFTSPLAAQLRKIGELDLFLRGVSATADQVEVTVPKNTMSGVRVTVRSGGNVLAPADVQRFVGGAFRIEAELSGPGLRETISLPQADVPVSGDPLLLTIPSLTTSGDYTLSNLRITANGRTALDVTPQRIPVAVIEQILITSVTTRSLTLDEIRQRGIVIDNDSYLGFEFTMGITMESKPVEISFPVVFDRNGVAVPQPLEPPPSPSRDSTTPLPTIVPMLLKVGEGAAEPTVRLPNGQEVEVRIPSVLVIPGNVGYLKQHFSAQLFVANGAPGSSNLILHNVTGKIQLPKGADQVAGSFDDPLTLPDTVKGPQPKTLAVNGIGPDGVPNTADDVTTLTPGAQAMAEFVIRGEKEGFHNLTFDVNATLDGLATGPVNVSGVAAGGVLVRNPYFDMTFTVPAVARQNEPFKVFVTVNNISQSIANDVRVTLDAARLSGARLVSDPTQSIDTLRGRDSRTLEYTFVSERTGAVVATYLNFNTTNGTTGDLKFTLGVGERGIALSPDTLVLPSAVDSLPQTVVEAAMRVLGQAWSISNAPAGTLPSNVTGINKVVATQKALALAEAGLRVSLGQPVAGAVRDLLFDFHGGVPVDAGFDQLLRETDAGRGLAEAIGAALLQPMQLAGGVTQYERATAQLAASGPDFVTFAATGPVNVTLLSSTVSTTHDEAKVPAAVLVPITNSTLGVIPTASTPYTLLFTTTGNGSSDLSVTIPRGSGTFTRAWITNYNVSNSAKYRIVADPRRTPLVLDVDANGDGQYETQQQLSSETLTPQGPRFVSATVIGPETIAGSQPFGQQVALLFDRVVDATVAAKKENYEVPSNSVHSAKRQLSGRLVFATLTQPEGPYIETSFTARNIRDARGVMGPEATVALQARLHDIGAVVSGRIIDADGTPVTSAIVTYTQNPILDCAPPLDEEAGIAATQVGNDGRFEFRYVRQDQCGVPFRILTRDPSTGAVRSVTSSVRVAGEHIVMDIALFGKGTVAGTVKNLQGQPVAGASVTALSDTDAQTSGSGLTDINGRYSISGVAVGTVRIVAAKGTGAGRAAGRLDRAGTTTTINVTLDGGVVNAKGKVYRVERGVSSVIPQLQVVYSIKDGGSYLPIAVTETTTTGDFAFTGMPTGEYRIDAALNTRDRGEFTGTAAAGQTISRDVIITIPEGLGTVKGVVRLPDGSPAAGALVSIDGRGFLAENDGRFTIPQVLVKPNVAQEIVAATRDGLRTGRNTIIVDQPNQVLSNVVVTLSGLGVVEITVTDAAKNPISDQEVALLGNCNNACGCIAVKTDGQGRARFTDLPIGRINARAIRAGAGYYDQAQTSVSLTRDGESVFGVLVFPGVGSVAGIVLDPDGKPALGADITLRSKIFDEDSCSLVGGVSHRMRTDESGRFQFNGINIGNVSVTATHSFFPTAAGESFTLNAAGAHKEVTLRLTNTISGELSGTIYLPDGQTRAGAGVEVTARGALPDVTVVTDAQGNYQFAKIFPQGSYTITVSDAVTGGVAQEAIYLRAAQDLHHDLRLKGRGTVRVTVVDGAGQPVQNAFIRLMETTFPNRSYESVIAPSNLGVATFNNVYEGALSAEASDAFARGGRVSSVLPRPGDTIELKVAMTTTGKIRGKFLRPDGTTPIPFGIVKLIAGNRVVGQTATAGSGDVGAFAFDFVPAGPVRLEAQDPLTARTGFAAGTIAAENETLTLDVLAQGLGSVQGLVTSNGVAQPGAHVDVDSGTFHACAIADSTGNYLMEGVPEGRVVVTASIDGNFLSGTSSATLTGEGTMLTLDVALRDSGTVTGVVTRSNGASAPLSVVTVQVGGTGGGTLATTTDAEGAYTIERVPAGLATATAEVAGGSDKGRASGEVEGGETLVLPIALNGTGIVSGRALDSAGNATTGDLTFTSTGAFPATYILKIGTDGAFTLRDVLAGSYTATLKTQNGGVTLYGSKSGTIAPDVTNDVTVQLQPTGSVKGLVKRADGTTAAYGASVLIELLPNHGSITVQTDNSGAFNANGIPLGVLRVRVTDPLTAGIAMTPQLALDTNGQVVDVQTLVLDDTPVSVVSVDPADGTIGVATSQPVVLTFSDPLASAAGIAVKNGTANVGFGAALSSDGKTVTLTGTWPDAKELTVVVSTAATDVFGRHPLSAFASTFRTVDLSPPAVTAIVPANGAFQVEPTAAITVTYSEALSTLPEINLTPAVTGTTTASSPTTVAFTPSAPLAADTMYTVSSNGAFDESGNRQTIAFTSSFGTTDTIAPVLTLASPATNTWVRSARPQIQVNAVDATSGVATATGTLKLNGQAVVPSLSGSTIYYAPAADLAQGNHDVQATIADRAGNTGSMQGSFRIDTVAPSVPVIGGITAGTKVQGLIPLSAASTDPTSGLDRIEVMIDGSVFQTLRAPDYAITYNTNTLGEGPRTFTARAFDVAGNVSEASPAISATVDNRPLTVGFSSPQANTPVRDVVSVQATGSEVMARIDFSAGSQTISDATAPYEATFDLTAFNEGPQQITATAHGLSGETAQASLTVVIDRTAPSAPNAARITAEPPQNGSSLLFAYSGAVEGSASIEITNTVNNATTVAKAAPDGTFSAYITAAIDDALRIVAIDIVGNRSEPTTITVRSTPSLPPSQGATALEFNGLLVDRVGMTGKALTPDGNNDAVFTLSISIGDGTTRTLSYIDLTGTSTRSTRTAINAILGVAQDAGGALLNRADGTVNFPVTSGTTLTLFAGDGGFIRPGTTYTVTAVFTDGSRFVDSYYLVPPEDRAQVAHSASIASLPATVIVPANGAATSTLTITNIRDIHGNLVPDGSQIALTATAWASRNPRNAPIGSAGGVIVDGEPAANNASFKVFTIDGGRVVATYSSAPVSPPARTGTFAVVQMQAADVDGNVIGTEAAATVEIPLRSAGDRAIVHAAPAAVFVDRADRRSRLTVEVRDAAGNPAADGTKIILATGGASWLNGWWTGGSPTTIAGGTPSPQASTWRVFTVSAGKVEAEFSANGQSVGIDEERAVLIEVLPADANGNRSSTEALGYGTIHMIAAAKAEVDVSPETVPYVFPLPQPVQVSVHHVHDLRANLVPDGSKVVVSASNAATWSGSWWVSSPGGTITDGTASPTGAGLKAFSLVNNDARATYSIAGLNRVVNTGEVATPVIQVAAADPSGTRLDSNAIALGYVNILGPYHSLGSSTESHLHGDGALYTTEVQFKNILDVNGNPLPEGSKVVVSANNNAAWHGTWWLPSIGGQILNGTDSPTGAGFKTFHITNGTVDVVYGNQGITSVPGEVKTGNIALMQAGANGERLSTTALGVVPVYTIGTTSAQASANPSVFFSDGADYRSTITIANIKDSLGRPVPEGTLVGVTAAHQATWAGTWWAQSAGGQILGGTVAPNNSNFKVFPVTNGQVVLEYSSTGVIVSQGEKVATVQVASANRQGNILSNTALATVPIRLLSPASARVIAEPIHVTAFAPEVSSQITVTDIKSPDGVRLPDGSKIGLSAVHQASWWNGWWAQSAGGTITAAGTTAGDGNPTANNGNFQTYTIAGGEVKAQWDGTNISAGLGQTLVARVQVVPMDRNNNVLNTNAVGVAEIHVHGVTSTTASGPASVKRGGSTATITFSNIKDSGGNPVPDGTPVVVTALNNVTYSSWWNDSAGGTITNGNASPDTRFKWFTVTNGAVTVEYSSTGAAASPAHVKVSIVPANRSGAPLGTNTLNGGLWTLSLTN